MQVYSRAVAPSAADAAAPISLRSVLAILRRGFWIVALCAVAAFAAAVAILATRTPVFVASASILLDRASEQTLDLRNRLTEQPINETVVSSAINVIRSNRVLGRVVETLDLTAEPGFRPGPPGLLSVAGLRIALDGLIAPLVGPVPGLLPTVPELTGQQRADQERRIAIEILASRLNVFAVDSSYVIEIAVQSREPEQAAAIANAVAAAYLEFERTTKIQSSTEVAGWLGQQIAQLEAQASRSQAVVDDFRLANGVPSEEEVEQLSLQLDRVRRSLAQAVAAGGAGGAAGGADLAARVETLERAVDEIQTSLGERLRARAELAELERRALADQRLYERFLEETNRIDALESFQQTDARVVADALVPLGPGGPSAKLIAVLALVLGAGFGVGIIGLRELLHNVFRSREELSAFAGLPVFGVIDRLRRRTNPVRLAEYVRDRPHCALAERARSLRASFFRGADGPRGRVVVVTSAAAGDGKTTVAVLLAFLGRTLGRSVVLVDLDLRRSRLGQQLRLRRNDRFADVLSGAADPAAAIQATALGFDVLAPTHGVAVAPDVLAAEAVGTLLEALRERYDYVIVDTPPLGLVADAATVARHAGGVVLAVRWMATSREMLADSLTQLAGFDVPIDGLVLTMADPRAEARSRRLAAPMSYTRA